LAIVGIDDPVIAEILPQISRPVITYGFSSGADVRAYDFVQEGITTQFKVHCSGRELKIRLNLPGKHNALNALAALAVAHECEVKHDLICQALQHFKGVRRRFDIRGEMANPKVLVIDDYGHHPREIKVTLEAIRAAWPKRRLVLVFQPHRYSRTRDLFNDFAAVLANGDVLLIMEIYAAGESSISGISSHILAQTIKERGHPGPYVCADAEQVLATLPQILRDDDILLLQGAGNIGSISQQLIFS